MEGHRLGLYTAKLRSSVGEDFSCLWWMGVLEFGQRGQGRAGFAWKREGKLGGG